MIWVLEETQQPGVYQLGFFGDSRRRGRTGNARDALKLWTALVGTLEQFEELGRGLLADAAALRALDGRVPRPEAAECSDEEAAG